MSYRIDYRAAQKKLHIRLPALTLLSFLLFLLLVSTLWPEGAEYIRSSACQIRIKTAAALNLLEEEAFQGEPLTAVFSDFFQSLCG